MLGNVMGQEDLRYFEARWQTEIDAANRARSETARRIHLQLAKSYAQMLADTKTA